MMQDNPKDDNSVRVHDIAMRDGSRQPSGTNRRQGKPKGNVPLNAAHQGVTFISLVFFLGFHIEPKVRFGIGVGFGLQLGSVCCFW